MSAIFISHSSQDDAAATRVQRALKDAHYDATFLGFDPEQGIPPGRDWEDELYRQLKTCSAVVALCSPASLASRWCFAEITQAKALRKPIFPVQVAVCDRHPLLQHLQHTDISENFEPAFAPVLNELARKLSWRDSFALIPGRPPYPGLFAFEEEDAGVFFGRDEELDDVLRALDTARRRDSRRFLIVLGASGCGKSSLVRAGIVPRLKREQERWVVAAPILVHEGFGGLARALAGAYPNNENNEPGWSYRKLQDGLKAEAIERKDIEAASATLSKHARDLVDATGRREACLLLVLDQLEEAFDPTYGDEMHPFLDTVLRAVKINDSPLRVLATLRSDFFNELQLFPGMARCYRELPLDPMREQNLADLIQGPAGRAALAIEPELVEKLVKDTVSDDALPLLAFTLAELYQRGEQTSRLTLQDYEALFPQTDLLEGNRILTGVAGAVGVVAESAWRDAQVSREEEPVVRRAFLALTRVNAQAERGRNEFARKVVRRDALPAAAHTCLELFAKRRLLVASRDAEAKPILSVAHEALFRVWPRLNDWLNEARLALLLREQLVVAARQWRDSGEGETHAWPDERIMAAVRELDRAGIPRDDLEDTEDAELVRRFLGPVDPVEIERVLKDQSTDHARRASGGDRLALLCDRRRGVGLRADALPDIDWRRVKGQQVVKIAILSDPANPGSRPDRYVEKKVGDFHIARYPVTVAQYQAFIEDGGYQDDRWWLAGRITEPPKPRARYANQPMDSVNWYDAMAFCEWLSARLNFEVQLPDEWQWQQAATGGKTDRDYPWGQEWDPAAQPWRANTYESELGRSTAVGLYPEGASPVGALDMAGTVWEWCLNSFQDPDDCEYPATEEDRRVLRGGSWYDVQDYARAAYRGNLHPLIRLSLIGFRLCCVSPIEG